MAEQSQSETQRTQSGHRHGAVLQQLSPILKEVQLIEKGSSLNSLLERVEAIYQNSDSKIFAEVLIRIMIVPFTDTKNENAIRVVNFFQKIVTKVGRGPETPAAENAMESGSAAEIDLSLTTHMIKLCSKYVGDQRFAVRSRLCETMSLLLKSIPNLNEYVEQVGNFVQEKLPAMLLNRLQDKASVVRMHSARALCYFQECDVPEKDRITNELLHHLKWDPANEVRATIAKFAQFNKDNHQFVIDKVNDLSEEVRKAALKTIADKIPLEELTIESRERILTSSLGDKSSGVKKMGERVLKEWTKVCDGSIVTLLTKLDVSCNRKTAELALKSLFQLPTPELFETVDRSIFVNKFIPLHNLTSENAFYWRFVVETFAQFPSIAELLIPNISDMCVYITEFVKLNEGEEEAKKQAAHSILPQLLKIILKTPMEEGGRVVFMETLNELFTYVNLSPVIIKLMMKLLYQYHQEGDVEHSLVQTLERMIKSTKFAREPAPPPPPKTPAPVEDVKALRLEIGGKIHSRHKKEKEKTLAAEAQDYLRAHALQDEINIMLEEIAELKNRLTRATEGGPDTETENTQDVSMTEEEGYSLVALSLAFDALITHLRKTQNVSSHVRAFYDSYVTLDVMMDSPYIRKQVLTLMTLVGLICQGDAGDAANACVQALISDDELSVKVRALQCLVDLIQHYGFDEYRDEMRVEERIVNFLPRNEYDSQDHLDSPLRNLLMYYLGCQDGLIVRCVVTGMIKLLLANRLSAPRIVSTLFCVWINPLNESSSMYNEISTWLPMYVKMGFEQAVSVADALIPSIRKIKTTSKKAYLSHAPVDRLISFVITNTDQKYLNGFVKTPEVIHEKIAVNILNELKNLETGPAYTGFAKALKSLNLSLCQEESVLSMKKKLLRLIKKANTKTMPSLKAFYKYLTCLCATEVDAASSSESEIMASDSDNEYENVEGFSSSDQEEVPQVPQSTSQQSEESESDEDSQEIIRATPEN